MRENYNETYTLINHLCAYKQSSAIKKKLSYNNFISGLGHYIWFLLTIIYPRAICTNNMTNNIRVQLY